MPKKSGLTFDRHREIATELRDIYHRLQSLSIEFGNAYSKNGDNSMPSKKLMRAVRAIGEARCLAEEIMFKEHPDQATTHIYYGQQNRD